MKVFEQRFAGRLSALVMNNLKMKFWDRASILGLLNRIIPITAWLYRSKTIDIKVNLIERF